MNLRIQTLGMFLFHGTLRLGFLHKIDDTTATDALQKGLDDLMDLCDVVTDKFTTARNSFNEAEADQMTS